MCNCTEYKSKYPQSNTSKKIITQEVKKWHRANMDNCKKIKDAELSKAVLTTISAATAWWVHYHSSDGEVQGWGVGGGPNLSRASGLFVCTAGQKEITFYCMCVPRNIRHSK